MKEIKISIIVPVFNEEKTLKTILNKINQQKITDIIFEIIVSFSYKTFVFSKLQI